MLESLKKKTLLGNLWCIIVLGIVTAMFPSSAVCNQRSMRHDE